MKRLALLAATAALVLPAALPAQTAAPAASDTPTFSAAAVRAHVEFLADDLLKGRDTGSEGHEIAARYVASQFDGLGLTPAGDADGPGGGWLQLNTDQLLGDGEGAMEGEGAGPSFTATVVMPRPAGWGGGAAAGRRCRPLLVRLFRLRLLHSD